MMNLEVFLSYEATLQWHWVLQSQTPPPRPPSFSLFAKRWLNAEFWVSLINIVLKSS